MRAQVAFDPPWDLPWNALCDCLNEGRLSDGIILMHQVVTGSPLSGAVATYLSVCKEAILLAIAHGRSQRNLSDSECVVLKEMLANELAAAKPTSPGRRKPLSPDAAISQIVLFCSSPRLQQVVTARAPMATELDRDVSEHIRDLQKKMVEAGLEHADYRSAIEAFSMLTRRVRHFPLAAQAAAAGLAHWTDLWAQGRSERSPKQRSQRSSVTHNPALPQEGLVRRARELHRRLTDEQLRRRRDAWWGQLDALARPWSPVVPGTPLTDTEQGSLKQLDVGSHRLHLGRQCSHLLHVIRCHQRLLAHDVRSAIVIALSARLRPQREAT